MSAQIEALKAQVAGGFLRYQETPPLQPVTQDILNS